jgi:hypothetical protein
MNKHKYIEYSEKWDADYSVLRNEWLDSKCDDPECEYCPNRPERPLTEEEYAKIIQAN